MKAEIHVIFPCVETILFFACVENLILSVESLIGHHFEYTPLFFIVWCNICFVQSISVLAARETVEKLARVRKVGKKDRAGGAGSIFCKMLMD